MSEGVSLTPLAEMEALEALREHPGYRALCAAGARKMREYDTLLRSEQTPWQTGHTAGIANTLQRVFAGMGKGRTALLDERCAELRAEIARKGDGAPDNARALRVSTEKD